MFEVPNVSDLNIGDEVGVRESGGGVGFRTVQTAQVLTVSRKTATQTILSNGSRWNARGMEVGSRGSARRYLCFPDEARRIEAEYKRQREYETLIYRLRCVQWREVPVDVLKQIITLVPKTAIKERI